MKVCKESQLLHSLISPVKKGVRPLERSLSDDSFKEFKNLELVCP
jgi:hypothetical protein